MRARWNCKVCNGWGLGGPAGWEKHNKSEHMNNHRLGAQVSFGFAGDYATGSYQRYKRHTRPAVAEMNAR